MGSFVPGSPGERREMLRTLGISSYEEMYQNVPASIRLGEGALHLEDGVSELEALGKMKALAEKNRVFPAIFRGAGSYHHYIPAIVKRVTGKEQFLTAYTPYQAEISQGILQSIFEYQTLICRLTGMDVANASVYDGASAAAEAAAMCRDRKRRRILISGAANPQIIETVKTYAWGASSGEGDAEAVIIPVTDGRTDPEVLRSMLTADTACVYIQQPNFYGLLEDLPELAGVAHAAGAKLIAGINPIAAAILRTPAECGADIAVGEGQPLGLPMGFGGPYLGFMAATKDMMRKLPGRIVGETEDAEGRRCYVLTLQAREQHIRREKASSNICSNEALCAMTAAAYMEAMGPDGMTEAASLCHSKAEYLAGELGKIGYPRVFSGAFFHEFVTACPEEKTLGALMDAGILPGLPVSPAKAADDPAAPPDRCMLWCCTELCTKAQMDRLVSVIKEVEGR